MEIEEPDLEIPEEDWIFDWILEHSVPFKADPTWEQISLRSGSAMVVCATDSSATVMATEDAFDRARALPAERRVWILVPTSFLVSIMPHLSSLAGVPAGHGLN